MTPRDASLLWTFVLGAFVGGTLWIPLVLLARRVDRWRGRRLALRQLQADAALLADDDAPDETHVEWFNYLDRDASRTTPRRNGRAS